MIDEPTDDPLDPDEVETTLAEQLAIDELAFSCAEALGRPVLVAGFHGSGRVTVMDGYGRSLDELRLVEVARDVPIETSLQEDNEAPQ